jgi:hypothetical protein
MATTLSYGFEKPATGDKGTVFWPALEDNIQQLNDHTHNGTNSARLTSVGSQATVQSVTAVGWSSVGDGLYRQLVTLPAALTAVGGVYNDYKIQIRNAAATERVLLLPVEKVSTTTFYVWINDNTIALKVIYT